jgi:transcriptional regulator PpsR
MQAPLPPPLTSPDLAALSAWAPELAKTFVSLASDIALVIDAAGVIRNVAQRGAEPIAPGAYQWVGRAWIDTVSGETRPKIENLLKEVSATGIARRREVNHLFGAEASIPVAYTAIRLGENGPVLAVGRDLRTIAAIQQRYVESQQEIERGYWQARQAEARYQLLFQVATDAVVVVDAATLQIVEANDAAATLFGAGAASLVGRHASSAFEHHSRGVVNELLASARTTGKSGELRARLQGTLASTSVVATPFRADDTMRLLVRMRAVEATGTSAALSQNISRLVDGASDGVVVTDSSGRVLIANPAFVALARLGAEAQLKGQPLMNWIGLADQPLAALVAQVRRDGIARGVESWVRIDGEAAVRVDISAALMTEGDQECIGFTLHPLATAGKRSPRGPVAGEALALVLRAGIEALGSRLDAQAMTAALRDAAALLGTSPEALIESVRLAAGTLADARRDASAP